VTIALASRSAPLVRMMLPATSVARSIVVF